MNKAIRKKMLQRKWYDKYLPFVARSPEMQLEWLVSVLKKESLSFQEVTPYIRLFLTDDKEEKLEILMGLISTLSEDVLDKFISAADIYDVPQVFAMISRPTIKQGVLALSKEPPPYEKNIQAVLDKLFWALHNHSEEYLAQASETLLESGAAPSYFGKEYARFIEIVEDEKILSALYPKARAT